MQRIRAVPLTAKSFEPYGHVISVDDAQSLSRSANQGTAQRFDFVSPVANFRADAKLNLTVFRAQPQKLPLPVRLMERHPSSTQVFLLMTPARFLVCVAPSDASGAPILSELKAFIGKQGQGMSYKPGVWHHPMVALDAAADFTMVIWEDGTPGDCEVRPHANEIEVYCDE